MGGGGEGWGGVEDRWRRVEDGGGFVGVEVYGKPCQPCQDATNGGSWSLEGVQGHLAHQKTPPYRPLQ